MRDISRQTDSPGSETLCGLTSHTGITYSITLDRIEALPLMSVLLIANANTNSCTMQVAICRRTSVTPCPLTAGSRHRLNNV